MARVLGKNFIVAYSEAIAKVSEAPNQYNIWAAISIIGAVAKNNVYFKRGTFKIYPNNYIVLVGPPGVGKGTAIHAAYELIKKHNLANIIPDRITAPKIIELIANGYPGAVQVNSGGQVSMAKDSSAVLFSTELQTLLTSSDWMLAFLCDAWDRNEFTYDTKNNGTSVIKGMCCSLIGACVPSYIKRLNTDRSSVNDGFTARTIFVYAEENSKKILWPESLDSTPSGKKLVQDLMNDLQHISKIQGLMSFTDAGKIELQNFYKRLNSNESDSEVVKYFKSRMLVHVIKVAMIFSLAERDDLKVTKSDVVNSVTCLKYIISNLDKVFQGAGESDLAEGICRVQAIIEKRIVISKAELLGMLYKHMTPEALDKILSILVQINFCSPVAKKTGIEYRYNQKLKQRPVIFGMKGN